MDAFPIAVQKGDIRQVKLILRNIDVNDRFKFDKDEGCSALIVACRCGHYDLAKYLLDKGADIDLQDFSGWFPLKRASYHNNYKIAKLLLKRGAKFDQQNSYGWTALMNACQNGHHKIAQLLLKNYKANANIQRISGKTALMSASGAGRYMEAELLIKYGAQVEMRDNYGETALTYASFGGHSSVVEMLISARAAIDSQDNNGLSALMKACDQEHYGTTRVLLEKGAKVDLCAKNGWSALMFAIEQGHLELIKLLLHHGAAIDIQSDDRKTPMGLAHGHPDILDLLEKEVSIRSLKTLHEDKVASTEEQNDITLGADEAATTGKSSLQDRRSQHKKKYEEFIKHKKTLDMLLVRVVNIGIPRSGKTTFWHRMMDPTARMKDDEPSTGLIDEQKPVVIKDVKTETGIVTSNEWLILDTKGGYARMLLEVFSQVDDSLSVLESSPGTYTPSEADVTTSSASPADPQADILLADTIPTTPPVFRSSFNSFFSKALESDSDWEAVKGKLQDMILLTTADTGGHAEFLDMHAALINGPSFYLLFSRLTDELDKCYKVYYTNEDSTSTKKEDSESTVKEVFFQALSSITCFGNAHRTGQMSSENGSSAKLREALESRKSKVMFAGTYGDMVTDNEFKEKDNELHQQIKGTDFYKNIMFADDDQMMLKVNNKSGGADEIKKIRAIFKEKIKKFFEPITIPASWFVLSMHIRDHEFSTMTLHECEVLAREINISPEELQTALWFLHHSLGDILYYPEGALQDIVFCKIQDVYRSVTKLIKKSYTVKYTQHDAAVTAFRNSGVFSLKEIEAAPEEENSVPRIKLVELLQHLKIITPAPSALLPNLDMKDPYLMPCMLRNYKGNPIPSSEGGPVPLLLRFKCGFLPIGIFPALINEMVSQVGELDWEIRPEGGKIFKNRVQFLVGVDVVYLMSHLHCLEIALLPKPSTKPSVHIYRRVRRDVEKGLQEVVQRMNYNALACYDYAFWCTECQNCKNHLAVHKEATPNVEARMICSRDSAAAAYLSSRHKMWLSDDVADTNMLSAAVASPSHSNNGTASQQQSPTTIAIPELVLDSHAMQPQGTPPPPPPVWQSCVQHQATHHLPRLPSDTAFPQLPNMYGAQQAAPHRISTLPGHDVPTYEDYIHCIPKENHWKLDKMLDYEHNNIDLHLGELATVFDEWEDIAPLLGLTSTEVGDVIKDFRMQAKQRKAALKKWKSKCGYRATYGILLEACLRKQSFNCADKIIMLLGAVGGPTVSHGQQASQLQPSSCCSALHASL